MNNVLTLAVTLKHDHNPDQNVIFGRNASLPSGRDQNQYTG